MSGRMMRLVCGGALLVVGIVSALSALLVGAGDSFSPLFTTPLFALAVICVTIGPAALETDAATTAALVLAAVAPAATLAIRLATGEGSPAFVIAAQAVGIAAAVIGAIGLTRGLRARPLLITLMTLTAAGLVIGIGADVWPSPAAAVAGVAVAAFGAVALAVVILGLTVQHGTPDASASTRPAASKVTGG